MTSQATRIRFVSYFTSRRVAESSALCS